MIRLAAEFFFRSGFASDPGGLGLGAHCGNGNISLFVFRSFALMQTEVNLATPQA